MNILWCEGFTWTLGALLRGLTAWQGVVADAIVVTDPDGPVHDTLAFYRTVVSHGRKVGIKVSAGLQVDPFTGYGYGLETLRRWSSEGYPCPGSYLFFDFEVPFHGDPKRNIIGYKDEKPETKKIMLERASAFLPQVPKFKRVRQIVLYPTIYSPSDSAKTLRSQMEVMDAMVLSSATTPAIALFDESDASPMDEAASAYSPIWHRLLQWYGTSLVDGMYHCGPAGGRTFWGDDDVAKQIRSGGPQPPPMLYFPGQKRMEEAGMNLRKLLGES